MSMDFTAYKAALKTWVEEYTGVTAVWKHARMPWVGKPRALLRLHTTQGHGVDEVRWAQDTGLPAGTDMVPTVVGNRLLVLSIDMEGRDQSPSGDVQNGLETLRSSLRLPAVQAAFRAAGLSFATSAPVVNLDKVVQDRMESRAVLDVTFNATAGLSEPSDAKADSYVDSVETTAEFDKGDGNTVGWTDEEMP